MNKGTWCSPAAPFNRIDHILISKLHMNLGIREINGLTKNANRPSMKTTLHLNNIKNEPLEPNGTSMSIKGVLLTDSTKRRKPSSKITRSLDWPVILRNTSTYNLTKKMTGFQRKTTICWDAAGPYWGSGLDLKSMGPMLPETAQCYNTVSVGGTETFQVPAIQLRSYYKHRAYRFRRSLMRC